MCPYQGIRGSTRGCCFGKRVASSHLRLRTGEERKTLKINPNYGRLRSFNVGLIHVFYPGKGIDSELPEDEGTVLSRRFDEISMGETPYRVSTAYKTKDKKVRPVDSGESDGSRPGGVTDWMERSKATDVKHPPGPYDKWILRKFSGIQRGTRLTTERIEALTIGSGLTIQERDVLLEMLYNREAALAFDFSHCGKIRPDVAPPQVIRTIEHKAWQVKGFPIPKALVPTVIEMLKERLKNGVLEPCSGPYRNPWFLVKKREKRKYRLINAAIDMNRHTIRDANLPPSVDEFSEEFAGCKVASLIDFFSGYDQIELDIQSRDLTAFQTPLGLLRMTTLPQGATNSVAQFVRIVTKILEDLIPNSVLSFLDDIRVKGLMSDYGGAEVVLRVQRYILKHI